MLKRVALLIITLCIVALVCVSQSCNWKVITKAIGNITETCCTSALLRYKEKSHMKKCVADVERSKVCFNTETVPQLCQQGKLLSSQINVTGQQNSTHFITKRPVEKVKFDFSNWDVVFAICLIKIVLQLIRNFKSEKIFAKETSWSLSSVESSIKYLFRNESKYNTMKGIYTHDLFRYYYNSITVFPLLPTYSRRLASFCSLRVNEHYEGVSFITLSDAGFYFTNNGQLVKCEGCSKELSLETFKIDSDPRESEFHNDPCSYVDSASTQAAHLQSDSRNVFCNDVPTQNCRQSSEIQGCEHDTNNGAILINGSVYQEKNFSSSGQSLLEDECGNESMNNVTDTNDESRETISPVNHLEFNKCDSAVTDEGYTSDPDNIFIDAKMVISEFEDVTHNGPIRPGECLKNPGHFAYFPTSRLTLEQLPSKTRCPAFLQFLQLFSKLTVKLTVNTTSKHRHRTDPLFQSTNQRVGTGFVLLEQWSDPHVHGETGDESGNGALAHVGKYVKNFVKKSKKTFYIQTNRHLVFDDEEAVSTTVEICIDEASKKASRCFQVVSVLNSDVIGDYRCTLVCRTSDHSFVRQVRQVNQEMLELADRLPMKTKKALTKKIFILEHPHGGEKVLSYGDSVIVKYQLLKDQKNRGTQLLRKTNSNQGSVPLDTARKMLLYAADTCQGSSGAPVIMFTKSSTDGHFVLDVWTHNGQHSTHGLGCSVMKSCTKEDLLNEVSSSSASNNESDSEDEHCPGKQKVDSPVFKVLHKPSYPDFTAYQNRLDTYSNWTYHSIHEPEHLAVAGFFYAGYSDCVRCFQCGLGLRSWKPGDDIDEQHRTHRPSCPFLQSQSKNKTSIKSNHNEENQHSVSLNEKTISNQTNDILGSVELSTTTCAPSANNLNKDVHEYNVRQPKDMSLSLLEKENEMLKVQLLCKVCHTSPIKDLFLPCGELCACSECSKLLTHCPSCNKQIMATVTVFFS